MEERLIELGVEMFKISLFISFPILTVSMLVGLIVSIFQATTQINEMTLSFIPKILAVVGIIILTMPWMLNHMMEYSENILKMIPTFIF